MFCAAVFSIEPTSWMNPDQRRFLRLGLEISYYHLMASGPGSSESGGRWLMLRMLASTTSTMSTRDIYKSGIRIAMWGLWGFIECSSRRLSWGHHWHSLRKFDDFMIIYAGFVSRHISIFTFTKRKVYLAPSSDLFRSDARLADALTITFDFQLSRLQFKTHRSFPGVLMQVCCLNATLTV